MTSVSETPPTSAVIIGANGGIGRALVDQLSSRPDLKWLTAISRQAPTGLPQGVESLTYDPMDEASIKAACTSAAENEPDLIICTIGTLWDGEDGPEKAINQLDPDRLMEVLRVNTVLPTLFAKHFAPVMKKPGRKIFAALSARVGSVSDNRLGGWYSYRASKAALNQLIRTYGIEVARRNDQAACVGLHPGTVDTDLSAPFQRNVPEKKLFTPDYTATKLLEVTSRLRPDQTGRCFDYAGEEVLP